MDLFSKNTIKKVLKYHETQPLKKFGQNFLIDKGVIKKIFEAAELQKSDVVLEIGPGIGNLTKELSQKVKKIITVEKDPKMVKILKEAIKGFKNIEIVQDDIRKIQISKLKIKNYKLIANLPFYLTAPTIRKFLENKYPPKEMILIIQKEVAQRISAKPPKMNLLAVSVQFYAKPKIISYVSRKSYWPQPKVDSAIIKITTNKERRVINKDWFFQIVKAGFSQPRKQILNNLSNGLKLNKGKIKSWLLKNNIQPTQRAKDLVIQDWINLTKYF